jgi:hypothetical protein
MAQVQEEVVVIKLSKLVKDITDIQPLVIDGFKETVESVAQELVGSSVIIEVEQA